MLSQKMIQNVLMILDARDANEKDFYVQELQEGLVSFTSTHQYLLHYNKKLQDQ